MQRREMLSYMGQLLAEAASSKQVSMQGSSPAVLLGRTTPDSVGVGVPALEDDADATKRAVERTKRVFQNTMLGKSIEETKGRTQAQEVQAVEAQERE